ncbi:MAG: UDP-2,4-diacetamido-2,4,6-trideoxy-beta-L-altropyranose hydrolase [Caldimonas sp.]
MKVAFRVDASTVIGTGHVMRCLTLANQLKQTGTSTLFICRQLPDHVGEHIRRSGHRVAQLPASADPGFTPAAASSAHAAWLGVPDAFDAEQTIDAMRSQAPWDWIVVDHYAIAAGWERSLREAADRVLVIDDLADREHDCDLLLDQNFYLDGDRRYDNFVPPACVRLLGPRYALLGPEFRELRRNLKDKGDAVRRLLVFFGGSDAGNVTSLALDALDLVGNPKLAVDVVVGAAHPALLSIQERCRSRGFACHVQISNLASLMAAADLALGAGGTATWERCSVGLPTLAYCLAENQERLIHDGSHAGLFHAPDIALNDAPALARHVAALIEAPALRGLLSRTSAAMVDAIGTTRVAARMQSAPIRMREATTADSDQLFAWRNDPIVRLASRSADAIERQAHDAWLAKVLADPGRRLLIGVRDGTTLGVVRFDLDGCAAAEVSIYLIPGLEGNGSGTPLLLAAEAWLLAHTGEVERIDAEVLENNEASRRLFVRCGYEPVASRFQKRIRP